MRARPAAEVLAELERFGIRLGLEPFRALLAALGNPERDLPVVLVAGTNGKGSTAAALAAIAAAARLRVGLYTSPHLERVEERIRVAGEPVATTVLSELLAAVLAAAAAAALPPPTYFEATTAAAFLAFAAARLDLAVVEVGLGGRLDATNAAEPRLAVITPIALDHTELLGETLALVAREKAGILRAGRPVLLAEQAPEAEAALLAAAAECGAPVIHAAERARLLEAESRGLAGHRLELALGAAPPLAVELPLPGAHQVANAVTAAAAATLLGELGWRIGPAAIAAGLGALRWPGRLEPVALPAPAPTVLLDAAHNPHGCAALADFLAGLGRPYLLVFAALADKDLAHMLPPLAAAARATVLTRAASPRAAAPAALAGLLPAGAAAAIEPAPAAALAHGLERARSLGVDLVVVAGSIYLVGELRGELRRRYGVPAPA